MKLVSRGGRRRTLWSVFVLAVSGGCEGNSGPMQVTDIPEWTLVEELRIGSLAGEDALTRVGGVLVGPDGRLYVSQPQESLIRIFDTDGRPVGSIGGEGDGPGEFRSMGQMGWAWEGRLFASDGRSRSARVFSLDGELLETISFADVQVEPPYGPSPPSRLLPDGSALIWPGVALMLGQDSLHVPMLRVNRNQQIVDTLLWTSRDLGFYELPGAPPFTFASQIFSDGPRTRLSPDGAFAVMVEGSRVDAAGLDSYSFLKVSADGDTLVDTRVPYQPIPVPPFIIDSILDARAAGYVEGNRPVFASKVAAREALERSGVPIPRYYPAVRNVFPGSDGASWVALWGREDDGRARWDVLSPEGELIAFVVLPPTATIVAVEGDHLWATDSDDFDVPYLVRYRIER